jgi:hypothetical protein
MQKCNKTKKNIEVNRHQPFSRFRGLVTFPPRREGWLISLYLKNVTQKMYDKKN